MYGSNTSVRCVAFRQCVLYFAREQHRQIGLPWQRECSNSRKGSPSLLRGSIFHSLSHITPRNQIEFAKFLIFDS